LEEQLEASTHFESVSEPGETFVAIDESEPRLVCHIVPCIARLEGIEMAID